MEIWVKTWKWLAGIRRLRWENNALKQRHFSPRSTQAMATHRSHIHLLMQCPWVKLMLSSPTMSCLKTTSKTSTTWQSLKMKQECILASIMDIVLIYIWWYGKLFPMADFLLMRRLIEETSRNNSVLNICHRWIPRGSECGRVHFREEIYSGILE